MFKQLHVARLIQFDLIFNFQFLFLGLHFCRVCLFVFDLVYLNGESLIKESLATRRKKLKECFEEVKGFFLFAKAKDLTEPEEINAWLEESVAGNCEGSHLFFSEFFFLLTVCAGLMVKTLEVDATYQAAKRAYQWLKVKKDYLEGMGDTLDLVPIAGYIGRGKRTGGVCLVTFIRKQKKKNRPVHSNLMVQSSASRFSSGTSDQNKTKLATEKLLSHSRLVYGGFLLACYDDESEEYQSICKIGTGFSDQQLSDFSKLLEKTKVPQCKSYFRYGNCQRWQYLNICLTSTHYSRVGDAKDPDVWFEPSVVWEVKAADLSISPVHQAGIGILSDEKGTAFLYKVSINSPKELRLDFRDS